MHKTYGRIYHNKSMRTSHEDIINTLHTNKSQNNYQEHLISKNISSDVYEMYKTYGTTSSCTSHK